MSGWPRRWMIFGVVALTLLALIANVKLTPSSAVRPAPSSGGPRGTLIDDRSDNNRDMLIRNEASEAGAVLSAAVPASDPFWHSQIAASIDGAVRSFKAGVVREEGLSTELLGVTACPARTFATWNPLRNSSHAAGLFGAESAVSDRVALFQPYRSSQRSMVRNRRFGIAITDGHCVASGVKIRLCTTRNTPASELSARRSADEWTALRRGTRRVEVVVDATTMERLGHTHLCIALHCVGACHAELRGSRSAKESEWDQCEAFGSRNVLMAPLLPTSTQQRKERRDASIASDILVLLVDSVSWKGFNSSFVKTRALLDRLDRSGRHQVATMTRSHATGMHSAVNHAPLFLGTHVDRCLAFKSAKEGAPKKKDGDAYVAFKKLLARVAVKASPTLMQRHFLKAFHDRGFRTGLLTPMPYMAPEATCFGLSDESDIATRGGEGSSGDNRFVDDFRWRFFSEAVTMFNREVGGSQGCIGDRHEADYVDEFIESFFNALDTTSSAAAAGRVAVVAAQTPHQRRWSEAMIRYFDARLAATLARFLSPPPTSAAGGRARAVLLLSDHGLGFGADKRAELLPQLDDVLNPVHVWITPVNSGSLLWDGVVAPQLRRAQQFHVSHFDVYATLLDVARGGDESKVGNLDGGERHKVSMISSAAVRLLSRRSCAEMGLFAHSCRHFVDASLANATLALSGDMQQSLTRAVVEHFIRVFGDSGSKGSVAPSDAAFFPCENVPQMVLTKLATLDFVQVSARALADGSCFLQGTFRISKLRSDDIVYTFVTAVSIVGSAAASEGFDLAIECSKAVQRRGSASLRIAQLTRHSPYAGDERKCGAMVAVRKPAPVDMQMCVCREGLRHAGGGDRPQFLGG